jgi:hypothetical protein
MSWSRSSSILVALFLVAALAGPAAAVTASDAQVPEEAQVGERITAEFTLEELYQNPQTGTWTLEASTALEEVTWTVSFYDQQGNQVATQDVGGQNASVGGVDPDSVAEVGVTVTGTVPEADGYSYPEDETVLLAQLEQVREGGTLNTIDSWEAVQYTEDSRDARQAIADAEAAIEEAADAGVGVEDQRSTVESAKTIYRDGSNLAEAVTLAEQAESRATDALEDAQSTQDRNQLLLYGGVAVVVLLVVAGLGYWYLTSRESHDKLG